MRTGPKYRFQPVPGYKYISELCPDLITGVVAEETSWCDMMKYGDGKLSFFFLNPCCWFCKMH